jgi:hypothetical protein
LLSVSCLKWLLYRRRNAKATDPRDKIFSLFSLLPQKNKVPQLNYSKSVFEVYLELVQYWMHNSKGYWHSKNATRYGETIKITEQNTLKIGESAGDEDTSSGDDVDVTFLNFVQKQNPAHELPSWVPDWSEKETAKYLLKIYGFQAAGSSTAWARITLPSEYSPQALLTIRGVDILKVDDSSNSVCTSMIGSIESFLCSVNSLIHILRLIYHMLTSLKISFGLLT